MDDIRKEFERRKALLANMNYAEAGARLGGFFEWLMSRDETKAVIAELEASVPVEACLHGVEEREPPIASTLEEVAAVGLHFLRECQRGTDPYVLADKYHIGPPYGGNSLQDYVQELIDRYVDPALDYIEQQLEETASEEPQWSLHRPEPEYPLELTESLRHFLRDHQQIERNAFIMMRFGETKAHGAIDRAIRTTLKQYGIEALRADQKEYHEDLLANVLTYIYGCRFGIAVFERLEKEDFNPNVSFEVGYLRGLRKPICLLKDKTLSTLQTDLIGKLYRSFDPQSPEESIPPELEKWLRDKDIISA